MSYYPAGNVTPSDIYGDNNFYYSGKQAFSKNSVNARVDYRLGEKHTIYASGGILDGTISSPDPYGRTTRSTTTPAIGPASSTRTATPTPPSATRSLSIPRR